MPRQRIYYDYVNEELVPYWYVLTFKSNEITWDKNVFFFDAIAPFEYLNRDQFNDSLISVSIYMSDLILNADNHQRIGINLNNVSKRVLKYDLFPSEVKQFIIPIPDINEVIKLLPNRKNQSFIINR
ncbi:hypothetical protein M4D55_23140 [Metabacillus idriensis]|uniref:hypothetical protein n=1 Tax=Metabacillus idriensis TaxID=324768 RepID=UPI00203A760A|nr:hypothetical protein [Metabacillus idriensis]MCM3598657.1 hypothetical protein [Metabacillus idriensis]